MVAGKTASKNQPLCDTSSLNIYCLKKEKQKLDIEEKIL
jgi:hypothetical protein